FRNRGFTVGKVEPHPQNYAQVAELSDGPKAVAAAAVVRGHFLDLTDPAGFDIKRKGDVVDVTVGSKLNELGSKTEDNQTIGQSRAAPVAARAAGRRPLLAVGRVAAHPGDDPAVHLGGQRDGVLG